MFKIWVKMKNVKVIGYNDKTVSDVCSIKKKRFWELDEHTK
jgi:hypothetical protein